MDFFDMANGMTKLELTGLMVETAKSNLEDLADIELDENDKKQLSKLVTLASIGATFKV